MKWKRALSLLLTLAMLVGLLPTGALASVAELMRNEPAENEGLLDTLEAFTGTSYDEAYDLLDTLGLLDADGNLVTDSTIDLDGVSYTLDEAMAMLEDPDTDLTRVAEVDGVPIALADLKTIVALERELAYLQEKYFTGRTFEGEALDNVNDLMNQLQSQGFRLDAELLGLGDAQTLPTFDTYKQSQDSLLYFTNKNQKAAYIMTEDISGLQVGDVISVRYKLAVPETLLDTVKAKNALPIFKGRAKIIVGFTSFYDEETGWLPTTVDAHEIDIADIDINNADKERVLTHTITQSDLDFGKLYLCAGFAVERPDFASSWDAIGEGSSTTPDYWTDSSAGKLFSAVSFYQPQGFTFAVDNKKTDRWNAFISCEFLLPEVKDRWSKMEEYPLTVTDSDTFYYAFRPTMGSSNMPGAEFRRDKENTYNQFENDLNFLYHCSDKQDAILKLLVNQGVYLSDWKPQDSSQNKLISTMEDMIKANSVVFGEENNFAHIKIEADGYENDYSIHCKDDDSANVVMDIVVYPTTDPETGEKHIRLPHYLVLPSSDGNGKSIRASGTTVSSAMGSLILANDGLLPTITSVTAPAGVYKSGDVVPITLTADEYILTDIKKAITDYVIITINEKDYTLGELYGENIRGKRFNLLYTVREEDAGSLQISIANTTPGTNPTPQIHDIHNNAIVDLEKTVIEGVTLVSPIMPNAVESLSADYANGELTFAIAAKQTEAYQTLYSQYAEDPTALMQLLVTVGENQAAAHTVTLGQDPDDAKSFVFTAEPYAIEPIETEQPVVIQLQVWEDGEWVTVNPFTTFTTVPAKVNVEEAVITIANASAWADGIIELSDTSFPILEAKISPTDANYTSGTWASSDESIAAIAQNGQITPTGQKVGTVRFTYTADNGTPDDTSDDVTSNEIAFTVMAGDNLSLNIPKYAQNSVFGVDEDVSVVWTTNALVYYPGTDVSFAVQVTDKEGNVVHTDTAAGDTKVTIPAGTLTAGYPQSEYTVTVRMTAPEAAEAVTSIVVLPPPTQMRITADTTTITDDSPLALTCTIHSSATNGTGNLTAFRMTDGSDNAEDVTDLLSDTKAADGAKITFRPYQVTSGLYDTYTIVYTESFGEPVTTYAPSTDSIVIKVYRTGALKLLADGQETDSIDLTNLPKVNDTLPTDSEAILALRQELGLIEYISINADDYEWSSFYDGIKWASSDPDVAGVYYRQGGLWNNIADLSYETYLPYTQMAVSSTTDGKTTITATHAATGMSDTVQVEVETLRDKFFLFQVTPADTTTLIYTDSKGVTKTAVTNADGILALYEPDGIASDIQLSSGTTAEPYLGTLFLETLVSGERDASKLQLYPLNTITLVPAARAEIYLTRQDGQPFANQTVTLRGGVYLAGYYCEEAQMGATHEELVSGKQDNTYQTDGDGKLTVYMDATQFEHPSFTGHIHGAALEYWFELTDVAGDQYYPMLVNIRGSMSYNRILRTGSAVVLVEEVPAGEKDKPFLAHQIFSYGAETAEDKQDKRDVRDYTGSIGPNSSFKYGELTSRFLLWGMSADISGYTSTMTDESGAQIPGQTAEDGTFPFSSIPVLNNNLVLDKETMAQWLEPETPATIRANLYQNGALLRNFTMPFRTIDLSDVKMVTEDAEALVIDMQGRFTSGIGSGATEFNFGDSKIAEGFLGKLTDMTNSIQDTTNPPFRVLVTPSGDNTIFNVLIWAGYDSLNLNEFDHNGQAFSTDHELFKQELVGMPSVNDAGSMAKGTYNPNQTYANNQASRSNTNLDFGAKLTGYYEGQFYYDLDKHEWAFRTLGGGMTAGAGISFEVNFNAMAGPVPLTASFGASIALELDFKAATVYTDLQSEETLATWTADARSSDSVNEYLTTLRINGYISAFGGFGFDYSIVALKIGLFGKLTADSDNKFLSRTYLQDNKQMNGQALGITGEVGIKFVAKLLFISYEAIIASGKIGTDYHFNDYEYITQYWKDARDSMKGSTVTLLSRDYIMARAARLPGWSTPSFNTDAAVVQSSANPGSEPVVNDDGSLSLYISDMDSENYFASRAAAGDVGTQGTVIDDHGYGDMSPDLAGTDSFTAAAWVRLYDQLQKNGGEEISPAEQKQLLNSTEIMVAVTNGADWQVKKLTDNASPDLAPAVAANGSEAVVFWRSVYMPNTDVLTEEDLIDFTARDVLYMSRYDGGDWSEPVMVYNGTAGTVVGLRSALLPTGEAIAAFTLDRGETGYEMAYCVVDNADRLGDLVVLTNDTETDTNPQVAAVSEGGTDLFVLGWYSTQDGGDIRMQAVGADGQLYSGSSAFAVPSSVNAVTEEDALVISTDFRFAKGENQSIDGLTLVWPETAEADGAADHSVLYGTQLCRIANGFALSAPQALITLPARTLASSFSAWKDGNAVNAYIFGTWYSDTETENIRGIAVPEDKDRLLTGGGAFTDAAIAADFIAVDYENLQINSFTPIVFTLRNTGTTTLTGVQVQVGSYTAAAQTDMNPGDSTKVTVMYKTGDTIDNPGYSITANGKSLLGDTLYLDYNDLGISLMQVAKEHEGQRDILVTLYNDAAAKLENTGRTVAVKFYTDEACTELVHTLSYTTDEDLHRIDQGSLTGSFTFDLADYVQDTLQLSEIPESGVHLYAKAEVLAGTNVMAEYDNGNNSASVLLTGPYARTGEVTAMDVTMTNSTVTEAKVELRNNSIQKQAGKGTLLAVLVDENGNVLEQQTAIPDTALTCEEVQTVQVTFTQTGSDVILTYAAGGSGLQELCFSGMQVQLRDFTEEPLQPGVYSYTMPGSAPSSTVVSFISNEPVTVNGVTYESADAAQVTIPATANTITVTSGGKTWKLHLNRGVGYPIALEHGEHGQITANRKAAPVGTSITLTITPDRGWLLSNLTVTDSQGGNVALTKVRDNKYAFTMPDTAVTVTASWQVNRMNPDNAALYYNVLTFNTNGGSAIRRLAQPFGAVVDLTKYIPTRDGYIFEGWFADEALTDRIYSIKLKQDTTVYAGWTKVAVPVETPERENPFIDVFESDWFYDDVLFVYENGLMNGTGGSRFSPAMTTTRGMIVTILWRLEGEPYADYTGTLSDVPDGMYYAPAVDWAAANGILNGYGSGRFGPDDPITREQMAAILWRYAQYKGVDVSIGEDTNILSYNDAFDISEYAIPALQWACGAGILQGYNGALTPAGNARRCEVAAILHRFCDLMED